MLSVRITVLTEWFVGRRALLTEPVRRHSFTNCWIVLLATYLHLLLLKPWRAHFFVQHCVNGFWSVVTIRPKMDGSEKWGVKCSEVKCFGEICVLSLLYSYVAVCMFCAVRCLITICFFLLFYNYSINVFNIHFMFVCLFSIFFYFCILCFYIVYTFVYSCLSIIFVQVSWPLPPGGNPIAVNKYHIIP